MKRPIPTADAALVATLLTFRPLNLTSFRRSKPQDAAQWGHHF